MMPLSMCALSKRIDFCKLHTFLFFWYCPGDHCSGGTPERVFSHFFRKGFRTRACKDDGDDDDDDDGDGDDDDADDDDDDGDDDGDDDDDDDDGDGNNDGDDDDDDYDDDGG